MKLKNFKFSKFFTFEYLVLGLLVLVGSFLRLQGVLSSSFAYTYDVGRDMLALWNIVVNHDIMFIGPTTGIQGVFYGPWWYYMLSPFFVIFAGNPAGIALTMALVGIVSIILGYIIGEKIGGKFLGFCFAALVSASPVLISLSTQIWNPNIAPLFVLLSFICLYKIYSIDNTKNNKYFFFLGIILALNVDIEIFWGVLFAIGIILPQIFLIGKKIKIKQILLLILGLLIVASPRIIFELKHGFIMTKSFITFLVSKNSVEDPKTFIQLLENRVDAYMDLFGSSVAFNIDVAAWLIFIFTVISVIVFYKRAPEMIKKFIVILLSILSVFFVGTLIFSRALWPHYLVGLPVIYIFLFSISLFLLAKKFSNFKIVYLVLIVIFLLNFNPLKEINNFFLPRWEGNISLYRNQLAVVDYVYKEAKGKDFKYVVYTPPVHDYTYQYLFQWYGPREYNYSPNIEANTAFFIIEPDPGYEDRPKWWLKDRENDGKIIKSETLKGGVVVQTRVH